MFWGKGGVAVLSQWIILTVFSVLVGWLAVCSDWCPSGWCWCRGIRWPVLTDLVFCGRRWSVQSVGPEGPLRVIPKASWLPGWTQGWHHLHWYQGIYTLCIIIYRYIHMCRLTDSLIWQSNGWAELPWRCWKPLSSRLGSETVTCLMVSGQHASFYMCSLTLIICIFRSFFCVETKKSYV